jgi:UDP-glucose 4-epimerase
VDDCVDAILKSAGEPRAVGEVLNVGVDRPTTFLELAKILVKVAGSGRWEFAPFSAERKAQEPGDFYSDISKIGRLVGWRPHTTLEDGLKKALTFYRAHRDYYWQSDGPQAVRRAA